MRWFLAALKQYANFRGRAQRAEYWYFTLFSTLIIFVLAVVDELLGTYTTSFGLGALSTLFLLLIVIPSVAAGVRRLHDIGRSGWWMLLWGVPIVGLVLWLSATVRNSQPGENSYGPNPKGA
jgi:uncharacterized membrane protein YhaH (DUF805 family)